MIRKKLVAALATVTFLSVASVFVPTTHASATAPEKVFVCKYVGTPGIDERLQTGNNPISVSISSIPNFSGIGSFFADRHGRSYVLDFDNRVGGGQTGEPSISDCPLPDAPDPESTPLPLEPPIEEVPPGEPPVEEPVPTEPPVSTPVDPEPEESLPTLPLPEDSEPSNPDQTSKELAYTGTPESIVAGLFWLALGLLVLGIKWIATRKRKPKHKA